MAFIGVDHRQDLPKVSYSTALDLFVGVCFFFVFAAILQFASVHYFTTFDSGEIPPVSEDNDSSDDETTMDTSLVRQLATKRNDMKRYCKLEFNRDNINKQMPEIKSSSVIFRNGNTFATKRSAIMCVHF